MKLMSFTIFKKNDFKFIVLAIPLIMMGNVNSAFADPLSYSPDQWPRNWNILIDEMNQGVNNHHYQHNNRPPKKDTSRKRPARSSAWGVPPVARSKPRRSKWPEYNTQAPRYNMQRPGFGYGSYYPGLTGLGLTPFAAPLLVPGMSPLLAPGMVSPGIPMQMQPFSAYPYSPAYIGVMPRMVY
ncbi:MAG: hypothetical protein GXP13_02745 [Gammaproteobacteria bacterium]|nr:hypothetical protein [Gammaproteobacteria bacterium]